MLPEIRMARIVSAIGRYWTGELSCLEAATHLECQALQARLCCIAQQPCPDCPCCPSGKHMEDD